MGKLIFGGVLVVVAFFLLVAANVRAQPPGPTVNLRRKLRQP